jgi:peptidoglycan-associated lipoprotein
MRRDFAAILLTVFLVAGATAQTAVNASSDEVAYWADYWSKPKVVLYGHAEEDFYQNMKDVMFPWNEEDQSSNPEALDENAQWLKDHPNVRLYVDGYASSRGELINNLLLSQRRADWVKHALVERGVAEDRIVLAVGWGQLYPSCPELDDACWSKNRLVRFTYVPGP